MTVARTLRIFGCGVVAIALVAASSGCGGSGNDSGSSAGTTTTSASGVAATPLDGWASGFCQAIASWQSTVKKTKTQIDNSQADFNSASQAIYSGSQALLGSLNGLGTPPAPASTQAQNTIDQLSTDLKQQSGQIQATLATKVSTTSQVKQASAQVRASIAKMDTSISNAVSDLKALPDSEGWKKSFQEVPACKIVATG